MGHQKPQQTSHCRAAVGSNSSLKQDLGQSHLNSCLLLCTLHPCCNKACSSASPAVATTAGSRQAASNKKKQAAGKQQQEAASKQQGCRV